MTDSSHPPPTRQQQHHHHFEVVPLEVINAEKLPPALTACSSINSCPTIPLSASHSHHHPHYQHADRYRGGPYESFEMVAVHSGPKSDPLASSSSGAEEMKDVEAHRRAAVVAEERPAAEKKLKKLWLDSRKYLLGAGLAAILLVAALITIRFHIQHDRQVREHQRQLHLANLVASSAAANENATKAALASNTTLVTAFFTPQSTTEDSNSTTSDEPKNATTDSEALSRSHENIRPVLGLRLPMVVYTDAESADFINTTRWALGMGGNLTHIHNLTSLEEIPLFARMRSQFQDVIKTEQSTGGRLPNGDEKIGNSSRRPNVDSLLIAHSKPYFLWNASVENPNHTPFFAWIDSHYGSAAAAAAGGNSTPTHFPTNMEWAPSIPTGQISLVKVRSPANDSLSLNSSTTGELLIRQNNNLTTLVSGEFIAGDAPAITRFHRDYENKLVEVMAAANERRRIVVDDDNGTAMLVQMINDEPELFNVVPGEWFNVFQLF